MAKRTAKAAAKTVAEILAKKPTAAASYAAITTEIAVLVELLKARSAAHAERAAKSPSDWGFVGDAGHVRNVLRDLVDGMAPASVKAAS